MNEMLRQIPARIKELREILEFTPEVAAAHLNIPVAEYLELEEGKKDIPISILYEIASFLNVDMTVLLTVFTIYMAPTAIGMRKRCGRDWVRLPPLAWSIHTWSWSAPNATWD